MLLCPFKWRQKLRLQNSKTLKTLSKVADKNLVDSNNPTVYFTHHGNQIPSREVK